MVEAWKSQEPWRMELIEPNPGICLKLWMLSSAE